MLWASSDCRGGGRVVKAEYRKADMRHHRRRSPIATATNTTSQSITTARPSTRAYQTDARICLANGHFILNCEYQRRSITLMKVSGLNHAQYVGTAHKKSTPPMNRRDKTPMTRALVTLSMFAVPMTGGHPTKCTSARNASARRASYGPLPADPLPSVRGFSVVVNSHSHGRPFGHLHIGRDAWRAQKRYRNWTPAAM